MLPPHGPYIRAAFLILDIAAHEYILPLCADAGREGLPRHEHWQREHYALHKRCLDSDEHRRDFFRAAAGRFDQRCERERVVAAYRREHCGGARPARRSAAEAAMKERVAAVAARPRADGPGDDEDRLLVVLHRAVVAVSDKHRHNAVHSDSARAPAASGLAPHNNRQEGDLSLLKWRLHFNAATRAPVIEAAIRVKHGQYTLRDNPLAEEYRADLPRTARHIVAGWATTRQKHATVLAAYDAKEQLAAKRAAKRQARAPAAETKEEKPDEKRGDAHASSDDSDSHSDSDAAYDEAIAAAAEAIASDGESEEDIGDSDESADDDLDGSRAAKRLQAETAPRVSSLGRVVRRKYH